MKKKILILFLSGFCFASSFVREMREVKANPFYDSIEQAEDEEVIRITEEISKKYAVCPELIQAQIFYESSNRRDVISRWGDVGYMQVNPKWQVERMENLGVIDLTDGYGNILVGCNLLYELFQKYGEVELVLMAYNEGEEAAVRKYDSGQVSDYARNIMELSEKLERKHGK